MIIDSWVMSAVPTPTLSEMDPSLSAQVVRLQAELVEKQAVVEQLTRERDQLRQAYEQLRLELELLKRRIFVAKAERVDTAKLEVEFAGKLAALDQLGDKLQQVLDQTPSPPQKPKGNKPTGRRDLREATLPEQRIELSDPKMEALCHSGHAERIGFEESCKLGWQRGGHVRLVVARVKYRQMGEVPQTTPTPLSTAPQPPLST